MLSKSQAKTFFLGGTAVTFLVFIGMTVYSLNPKNDQSNRDKIDANVIRGKEIWESNNCMGCHTILGEGAYYAPELTKVYERRGPDYIKAVVMSPVPWAPNGRKMVCYKMNDADANAVVAYFKWIGEINLNGFEKIVSPLSKSNN